jgi:hypothetical protein
LRRCLLPQGIPELVSGRAQRRRRMGVPEYYDWRHYWSAGSDDGTLAPVPH